MTTYINIYIYIYIYVLCKYTYYITYFKDFDFGVADCIFSVNFIANFIVCFIITNVHVIVIANDEQKVTSLA